MSATFNLGNLHTCNVLYSIVTFLPRIIHFYTRYVLHSMVLRLVLYGNTSPRSRAMRRHRSFLGSFLNETYGVPPLATSATLEWPRFFKALFFQFKVFRNLRKHLHILTVSYEELEVLLVFKFTQESLNHIFSFLEISRSTTLRTRTIAPMVPRYSSILHPLQMQRTKPCHRCLTKLDLNLSHMFFGVD